MTTATTIQSAGYIVHDGIAIMGVGHTADAAWDDYMTAAGLDERDGCECIAADAGLLAMVSRMGGCGLSWAVIGGIATLGGEG